MASGKYLIELMQKMLEDTKNLTKKMHESYLRVFHLLRKFSLAKQSLSFQRPKLRKMKRKKLSNGMLRLPRNRRYSRVRSSICWTRMVTTRNKKL